MKDRVYMAIDLRSFYASVECVERSLDPLTTNLVVADKSRTDKTICLAVTPSLKAYGISGRARLFEVVQKVAEVNAQRQQKAPKRQLTGSSWHDPDVKEHLELALDYLVAPPRMASSACSSTRDQPILFSSSNRAFNSTNTETCLPFSAACSSAAIMGELPLTR